MKQQRLLTGAAASYLGWAPATLKWRRAKNLAPRSYIESGRVWWDVEDLDKFLVNQRRRTERGVSA